MNDPLEVEGAEGPGLDFRGFSVFAEFPRGEKTEKRKSSGFDMAARTGDLEVGILRCGNN